MYDYDYPIEEEFELHEKFPRDKSFDEAKESLLNYFRGGKDNVCYSRQLQVNFEDKYFHWITSHALDELDGTEIESVIDTYKTSNSKFKLKFFKHKSKRYSKAAINRTINILKELSDPIVSKSCGKYAEALFKASLEKHGFMVVGEHTKQFKDRVWTETDHNFDYIISKDGIAWGVEIKNTYEYIPRDEMDIKITMCKFLGIRPLFALRFAPKSYIYTDISKNGGLHSTGKRTT